MSRDSDGIGAFEKLCFSVCEDLKLLASVYVAHFIISRKLRTRRKERAARLKNFKLINGGQESSVRMNEKGKLRHALTDRSFDHRGY